MAPQMVARAMQPSILHGLDRTRVAMLCRGLARLEYQPSRGVVATLCTRFEDAHGPVCIAPTPDGQPCCLRLVAMVRDSWALDDLSVNYLAMEVCAAGSAAGFRCV